jgi:hypothetical protein
MCHVRRVETVYKAKTPTRYANGNAYAIHDRLHHLCYNQIVNHICDLVHNPISLAVDRNPIQNRRNSLPWVSINVSESLLVVDHHDTSINRKHTSREHVRGDVGELDAGSYDLIVGCDGSAEEQVLKRDIEAIAGDGGCGVCAEDIVGKSKGEIGGARA